MTTEQPDYDQGAVDRASRIIAQALMEAEVILATDRASREQAVPQHITDTLDRFGAVIARLVDHTEQLAERMAQLTEAVATLAEAQTPAAAPPPAAPAAAKPELPELERSFTPGGEGVDVTISSVPGFQGLMELQRALVRLPQVQSAAVRKYQDDEASIQLVLSQPMTGSAIAGGITSGTGHQIFVDESRPEALRLRLRFLNAQG